MKDSPYAMICDDADRVDDRIDSWRSNNEASLYAGAA